ncbi:MAG: hypothetical protein QGD94_08510, partial [Planctomycetia bacterium]|nr:hypothetical protein [Planctomycetia bacterium]
AFSRLELQKVDQAEAVARTATASRDPTLSGFFRSKEQQLYITRSGGKMAERIGFQISSPEDDRQEVVYQERGITKTRYGRGAIVYCFLPYLELGEKTRRSRLFRQLLTNLGCALHKTVKHK